MLGTCICVDEHKRVAYAKVMHAWKEYVSGWAGVCREQIRVAKQGINVRASRRECVLRLGEKVLSFPPNYSSVEYGRCETAGTG